MLNKAGSKIKQLSWKAGNKIIKLSKSVASTENHLRLTVTTLWRTRTNLINDTLDEDNMYCCSSPTTFPDFGHSECIGIVSWVFAWDVQQHGRSVGMTVAAIVVASKTQVTLALSAVCALNKERCLIDVEHVQQVNIGNAKWIRQVPIIPTLLLVN